MQTHRLQVGTSGFDYRHWDGRFYPDDLPRDRRLAYYAEHFQTLELNVTFYRTPRARTFVAWRDQVPDSFRFAVKASRYLTHIRRLKNPRASVEYLMDRVSRLGDRLGPILLQLPPNMPIDLERLDETLQAFGDQTQVAVEPRHASWFTEDLRDVLAAHRAALCLADRRGPITPIWRTARWTYLRFHQGRASPSSCYGYRALASWASRLTALWDGSPAGYVFFNKMHMPARWTTHGGSSASWRADPGPRRLGAPSSCHTIATSPGPGHAVRFVSKDQDSVDLAGRRQPTMRVLAASFPDADSARAAQAQLIAQLALEANQIGVEALAPMSARSSPRSILAGRFQDEVVQDAQSVVEGHGGTMVIDIEDGGRNA